MDTYLSFISCSATAISVLDPTMVITRSVLLGLGSSIVIVHRDCVLYIFHNYTLHDIPVDVPDLLYL